MPDEFRTMAACEALGIMLPVFERYGSLVTLIFKEILRSVYEVPPWQAKAVGEGRGGGEPYLSNTSARLSFSSVVH